MSKPLPPWTIFLMRPLSMEFASSSLSQTTGAQLTQSSRWVRGWLCVSVYVYACACVHAVWKKVVAGEFHALSWVDKHGTSQLLCSVAIWSSRLVRI